MKRTLKMAVGTVMALALAACEHNGRTFPNFQFTGKVPSIDNVIDGVFKEDPPVIRQPVVPEMLINCRGHVFVPALGMKFIPRGKEPPAEGQYLREERLTAPYRIVPAGARVSVEQSPTRLNVELDKLNRIIGFYCG